MKKKPTLRVARQQKRAAAIPQHKQKLTGEIQDEASNSFPVVGIGASAGGLEALEFFFKSVPKKCGLGFVVVQHLDPTHKDILVELLQHSTIMPVVQITDGMEMKRDHVYVIPPNKDLSILHCVLHLLDPVMPRGLRLPIDFFLRSLADDRQHMSVGVILSGMGSDGVLGLRAIKARAGGTFVQTPNSAKFDSMPLAAIEAGLADVTASAQELPGRILEYLKRPKAHADDLADRDQNALEKVLIVLRAQTGHDFSLYKKSTIFRRVERRVGLHQLASIADYVRYLRENPQESELLFKELLIGVTSFFRDPAAWNQLRDQVIPQLLAAHPDGAPLRAWTVGCSTGEEAFSLAIVFKETLEKIQPPTAEFSLQIFATDLDKDAIDKARAGLYPPNISADVSEDRLRRFFTKHESGGYCVKKEIRETVVFAPQNLVMHPPFTKLDFVTCRNLLIYLDTELQQKLMPLFHFSLNSGGVLLLGNSETVGAAHDLFVPIPGQSRLYRRLDTTRSADLSAFPFAMARARIEAPSSALSKAASSAANLQSLADQLLLQGYAPAAVLVTKEGDILYVSGKTGRYLEPAAGKANWNLFAMCRDGLGNALSEAFHKAVRQKAVVKLKNVKVGSNDGTQIVDVTVQPVTAPEPLRETVLVVFSDVAKPAGKALGTPERATIRSVRFAEMSEELRHAYEDLQSTRTEMQTSQEELKSTNEELQSMNEELQSTNEELTTSKEEMQSMNEELQTVNHEMEAKVHELSHTGNDMKNLLDSTDIAILFLDSALLVRRFTPQTASIIKLIPSDVGRPITDVATALDYPELVADAQKVLETFVSVEKHVAARDKRWFTVRIMCYRTLENRVDGLVFTFTDITSAKNLEVAFRTAQSDLEMRFNRQTGELDKAHSDLQIQVEQRLAARAPLQ